MIKGQITVFIRVQHATFCTKNAIKSSVCIIHECALYPNKYKLNFCARQVVNKETSGTGDCYPRHAAAHLRGARVLTSRVPCYRQCTY